MKRLDIQFDIEPLLDASLVWLKANQDRWNNQVLLSHRQEDIDRNVHLYRRMYGLGTEHPYKDGERIHSDSEFNVLAPELAESVFAPVWNGLQHLGDLCRYRIVALKPRFCYEYHCDQTLRYHIALQTHPKCLIVEGDSQLYEPEELRAFHVPADGYVYELNGRDHVHSAMNGSSDTLRIHLIVAQA